MIYIALGSNIGDTATNIQTAITALNTHPNITVTKTATPIATKSVTPTPQPDYLNTVLEIDTPLNPEALLDATQEIETQMGQAIDKGLAPRLIDIDILLYHGQSIQTDRLTIPHPRMFERDFVLEPLNDIAPTLLQCISLDDLPKVAAEIAGSIKKGDVILFDGPVGAGKTTLISHIAKALGYQGHVQSPSYTLANQYDAPAMTIYHLDLYRLDGDDALWGIDLERYLSPDGVSLVEWGSRISDQTTPNKQIIITYYSTKKSRWLLKKINHKKSIHIYPL